MPGSGQAPGAAAEQVVAASPISDPRAVPIEPDPQPGPPLGPDILSIPSLRQRFLAPPVWQPEFTADPLRFRAGRPRDAAVLVPIVARSEGPTVLLTERTAHLNHHAGQVAFPGGRCDPGDADAVATALREAHEEVGLDASCVEILGTLPVYLTGTGYQVTPVVAFVRPGFTLTLQPFEVAEAFEVPLRFLMDPAHHQRRRFQSASGDRVFYAMPYRADGQGREYFIWGATAAMLRNLYRFLSA